MQQAFDARVIPYIIQSLDESNLYDTALESNAIGYRSVMKGLLFFFFSCFPVNHIPEFENVVECVSKIVEHNSLLALQFWEQDYSNIEKRSVLDTARSRFPLHFHPLCRLVASLCPCAPSADFVFAYFAQIPSYTDVFGRFDLDIPRVPNGNLGRSGSGECTWLNSEKGLVPGVKSDRNLYLPFGCPGMVVSTNPLAAQLKHHYSGWHFFIYKIESFLEASRFGNEDFKDSASPDTILSILRVYLAFFRSCTREAFDLFLDHCSDAASPPLPRTYVITSITAIISRCSTVKHAIGDTWMDILTCSIGVLELFLDIYPEIVWSHLRRDSLLPQYSLPKNLLGGCSVSLGDRVTLTNGDTGFLQNFLLPVERQRGRYTCLIAFLRLVKKLTRSLIHQGETASASERPVLISCIIFVHSEVFSNFSSWRYVDLLVSGLLADKLRKNFLLLT